MGPIILSEDTQSSWWHLWVQGSLALRGYIRLWRGLERACVWALS